MRITRNRKGRDYIVGDVHGCFSALRAHLALIGFDENTDRLFYTGDLVDRGPEFHQVIEWLSQPWFISVRGNHEALAIGVASGETTPATHLINGGQWFVDLPENVQALVAEVFSDLLLAIELETAQGLVGVVHAECPAPTWGDLKEMLDSPETERIAHACMWSRRFRMRDTSDVPDVRAMIVGPHAPEQVDQLRNTICIDTGALFDDGHFTIIDAETLQPARICGFTLCGS